MKARFPRCQQLQQKLDIMYLYLTSKVKPSHTTVRDNHLSYGSFSHCIQKLFVILVDIVFLNKNQIILFWIYNI
jgi:hypothetical protein